MTDFNTMFEDTRLTAYLILLKYYVIPRTRLRALISRFLGKQEPTLQHMLANATIRWLSSTLSIHQFRALSSGQCDANALLQNCPTLLEEKATAETVPYLQRFDRVHILTRTDRGGRLSGALPGQISQPDTHHILCVRRRFCQRFARIRDAVSAAIER